MTTHTQPQLTMHAQGFGRGNVPGAHRRNKGGGNTPPKQRWEGLPKDEDEPK
jgi:hypothetical protein